MQPPPPGHPFGSSDKPVALLKDHLIGVTRMAEAQADFQRGEVTGPTAHNESVTDGTQTRVSHRAQWCSVQDGDVLPSVFTEAEGGSRQDQCSLRSPHRANGPRGSPERVSFWGWAGSGPWACRGNRGQWHLRREKWSKFLGKILPFRGSMNLEMLHEMERGINQNTKHNDFNWFTY